MGDKSSDEVKLCPTRKKNLTFEYYFFSQHAENSTYFSPKSVVFLPQKNQNFQNISDKKKNLTLDKAQKPLSGSVAHRIY